MDLDADFFQLRNVRVEFRIEETIQSNYRDSYLVHSFRE